MEWRAMLAFIFCCLRSSAPGEIVARAEPATPAEREVFVLGEEEETAADDGIPDME